MRSSKSFLIFSFLPVLLPSCTTTENKNSEESPNIILILADDMGYSDISPFGSEISTPNLQTLADQGMLMTRFYNAARCCPSRSSILTGLYPHQTGLAAMADLRYDTEGYQGYLSDHCITIAEALKTSGYNTYMCGKWHVGDEKPNTPAMRGFDKSFAFLNGATSYYNIDPYRDSSWINIAGSISLKMELNGELYLPPDSGYYSTDAYTDYAIRFISEQENKDEPFFLYLAYTAPHWPLHAPEDVINKYLGNYRKGWDDLRQTRYARQKKLGIIPEDTPLSPGDSKSLNRAEFSDQEIDRFDRKMAVYAAMIDRMDWNIGRLVAYLEESGELDNSLILFLSDNGGARSNEIPHTNNYDKSGLIGSPQSFTGYGPGWANASNTPFRELKATAFFGGIATPFIAWYPAMIKAGSQSDYQGHINDLMPTLLEITGTEYPETYNGKALHALPGSSLVPVWTGESCQREKPLFFEHFGSRAIIKDNWKLVSFAHKDWELYNIINDPVELNNLADSMPDKLNQLKQEYESWADSLQVLEINDHQAHRLKKPVKEN